MAEEEETPSREGWSKKGPRYSQSYVTLAFFVRRRRRRRRKREEEEEGGGRRRRRRRRRRKLCVHTTLPWPSSEMRKNKQARKC